MGKLERTLPNLLFGLAAWAAANDDPVEVLMRVHDRVMAHAQRIPNHTCTESITRDWYEYATVPAPKSCDALLGRRAHAGVGTLIRLAATDRLRLEVALADSREIYAWPGAARFDDREIDRFVPPGAIATGPFAAALLDIFALRDPKFVFEGEKTLRDRHLMEYSFRVSERQSHFNVKAGEQWLITGYTGTLLADPVTADLVELTLRTEELPAETNACEVDATLEYGMVRLRGDDYLIPAFTRQRFIGQDGSEYENTLTFSACHEFRGDSTVTFGEDHPAPVEKPQANIVAPLELPANLPVWVDMTSIVQIDQAAAGDRVEGRLAEPIRDSGGILVAKGAAVEGRLVRVGTTYGNTRHATQNEAMLGLRWDTVEVNGVKRPFFITPEERLAAPNGLQPHGPGFGRAAGELRFAIYQFPGDHVVVKDSLRSKWFTFKP